MSKDKRFFIDGPAGALECLLEQPLTAVTGGPGLAVICHPHPLYGGTMDNKVAYMLARACQQMGYQSLRFNFRSVGCSAGQHDDGIGEVEDCLAVVSWLQQQYPGQPLVLAGFSFGSYIAASVAAKLKPELLLLVAPPVHHYDFDDLPHVDCPVLVIQGGEDEVVPATQVYQWADDHQLTLEKMPQAGHFFHGQLVELREKLCRFIEAYG